MIVIDPHELMNDNIHPLEESTDDEYFWDYETGSLTIYRDKLNNIRISYRVGQWNDSGVDPPSYLISYGKYWAALYFNETIIGAPFIKNNDIIEVDYGMKLADFVTIVKSPFPLELSDGKMGDYHENNFHIKDIIIQVDLDHLKNEFERFNTLKVFL